MVPYIRDTKDVAVLQNVDKEDAMPWVIGLTDEELKQLKNQKKQLTSYGKQKIREKMNKIPDNDEIEDIMNIELTEEKKEQLDRMRRKERILERYNDFYNLESSSMPHGMITTPEHAQAIALESMIDALRCEHLNEEYTHIAISDIQDLITQLYKQANDYLEKVRQ